MINGSQFDLGKNVIQTKYKGRSTLLSFTVWNSVQSALKLLKHDLTLSINKGSSIEISLSPSILQGNLIKTSKGSIIDGIKSMTPKFDIEDEETYSIHYIEDGAFLTSKNTVSYYSCKPVSDNLSCTLKTSKQISLTKAFSNIYTASVGGGLCMFGVHSDENNTLAVCIDSAHVWSTAQIEYKLIDVAVVLDSRHIKLLNLHDSPDKSFFRILRSSKS